jgi:hypothetical protein
MKVIYLTKEQADKVRGRHGVYSELQPTELPDGNLYLPTDVMDDSEHRETLNDLGECKFAEMDILKEVDEKTKEEIELYSIKAISPVKITEEKALVDPIEYIVNNLIN